jgi:hypothetical protein
MEYEDIQDKNFLSNDLLFNQLYPYQSRFGFAFNTSNISMKFITVGLKLKIMLRAIL